MRVFAWVFGVLLFLVGSVGALLLVWEALLAPSPGGISGSISLTCVTVDASTTCNGPTSQGSHVRELSEVVLYSAVAVGGVVGGCVLMSAGVLAGRRVQHHAVPGGPVPMPR